MLHVFQCPLVGRCLCNPVHPRILPHIPALSVPSRRAVPLQCGAALAAAQGSRRFQCPLVGRCLCNLAADLPEEVRSHFQCPLVGRCLCNDHPRIPLRGCLRLSVPSRRAVPLQYAGRAHRHCYPPSFSALSSGGASAMWTLVAATYLPGTFQCPLVGRCLCNAAERVGLEARQVLSVPSRRAVPLQSRWGCAPDPPGRLSVPSRRAVPLQSASRACTRPVSCALSVPSRRAVPLQCAATRIEAERVALSVPSRRAVPLQSAAQARHHRRDDLFQCPLVGRCLCNRHHRRRQRPHHRLSVPSRRAVPLQYPRLEDLPQPVGPFSALSSGGASAIQADRLVGAERLAFQCPLVGRCLCNARSRCTGPPRDRSFSALSSGGASAIAWLRYDPLPDVQLSVPSRRAVPLQSQSISKSCTELALSVPSRRAVPLQLFTLAAVLSWLSVFQCPLVGRCLCNPAHRGAGRGRGAAFSALSSGGASAIRDDPAERRHQGDLSVPSRRAVPLQLIWEME